MADEQASGTPGTTDTTVARPDFIPESYWDAEKNAPKADELKGAFGELDNLRAANKAANEAAASLPKDEAGYKIELPPDFKIPEGQTFKVDEADPLVKSLRAFAVKHKLPQDTVTGMVGMYMQIVTDGMNAEKASRAEIPAPLLEATSKWLSNSQVFENDEQRMALAPLLLNKQGVETLARIQAVMTGLSGSGHSGITAKPKGVDTTGKSAMQIFEAANN